MSSEFEIKHSIYGITQDENKDYVFSKRKQILKSIGPDEVLIKHDYIGFNYYDFDTIKNFKKNKLSDPSNFKSKIFVPGIEAIGKIKMTGENAREFGLNERVIYVSKKSGGAYGEYNIVNKNLLISPPEEIPSKDALALASRGIMAHMLLKKVYMAEPGKTTLLITNPTGALGHILAQIARFLDLRLIASVQNDENGEKKKLCKRLGFFDLIVDLDQKEKMHEEIMEFTGGLGANLIIDTIGGQNLNKLLNSMLYCGLFISLGQNSGIEIATNMRLLKNKSIFLTRPSLFDYKAYVHELRLSAFEVFQLYFDEKIKPRINKIYNFDDEINDLIFDAESRNLKFMNLIKV